MARSENANDDFRHAVARAAAMSAGFGFVLGVDMQRATSGLFEIGFVVLALLAGAVVARLVSGRPPLPVTGVWVALVSAWLLPQRADIASAVILAVLFGAGAGLAAGRSVSMAKTARLAIVPLVVLAVGRLVGSQDLVVAMSAALIVAAACAVRPTGSDATSRRLRAGTTAAVFLVVTVGFAMYVGAETPSVHWFGGGITHGPTAGREVALTFDDGPNLTATLPIMRILDAGGVKATFFEVGHAIDKVPWVTQALYKDGQGLGNHSYHHDQWRWLDPRYPELQRTQNAYQRTIGVCPAFYRPPHGDRTPFLAHVVNDHDMRMIMWDDSAATGR